MIWMMLQIKQPTLQSINSFKQMPQPLMCLSKARKLKKSWMIFSLGNFSVYLTHLRLNKAKIIVHRRILTAWQVGMFLSRFNLP